jgi:hypothetical protein
MSRRLMSDDDRKSHLLSEDPYKSLAICAKAVQMAGNGGIIEAALTSINQSRVDHAKLLGHEWINKFLLISLAAKFPVTAAGKNALRQMRKLRSVACKQIVGPVVVVAGGCSSEVEVQMRTYRGLILKAFHDFEGSVISGGTASGISGLIGEVQQKYPNTIRAIGYVPKTKTHLLDKRYGEIRFTEGEDFSPTEPLQYWIDIIASGIESSHVRLLGIDGEKISAVEYRMALAMDAQVAVVKGSGMEADKLFLDKDWNKSKNLISLTNDPVTVSTFIQSRQKQKNSTD